MVSIVLHKKVIQALMKYHPDHVIVWRGLIPVTKLDKWIWKEMKKGLVCQYLGVWIYQEVQK